MTSSFSSAPNTPVDVTPAPATIIWSDPLRAAAFAQWLAATSAACHLDPATLRLASADASFRRYLRLDGASAAGAAGAAPSFIVMDAPPDKEDCKPVAHVAGLMAAAGLPVML